MLKAHADAIPFRRPGAGTTGFLRMTARAVCLKGPGKCWNEGIDSAEMPKLCCTRPVEKTYPPHTTTTAIKEAARIWNINAERLIAGFEVSSCLGRNHRTTNIAAAPTGKYNKVVNLASRAKPVITPNHEARFPLGFSNQSANANRAAGCANALRAA